MTMSYNMNLPTYVIYRDHSAVENGDLAAPLVFLPPNGSDELFDALRAKYPHLRTHSERMAEATTEFFMREYLELQQLTPHSLASATTSPQDASLPSFCSEASTWSSPDAFTPITPSISTPAIPLTRQQSTPTSVTSPADPSPPALEAMTGVFSLTTAAQPKQHKRRTMTESEKVDYRKRRLVRACDKCSMRKRKCTHNVEEMDKAISKNSTTSKRKATQTSKKPHPPPMPNIQEWDDGPLPVQRFSNIDAPMETAVNSSLYDFGIDLADLHAAAGVDDLLATSEPQWPWSDTADWTLLDPLPDQHALLYSGGFECQPDLATQQIPLFADFEQISNNNGAQSSAMDQQGIWDSNADLVRQDSHSASPMEFQQYSTDAIDPSVLHSRIQQERSSSESCSQEDAQRPMRSRVSQMNDAVLRSEANARKNAKTAADSRASQRSSSLADRQSSPSAGSQHVSQMNTVATRGGQDSTYQYSWGGLMTQANDDCLDSSGQEDEARRSANAPSHRRTQKPSPHEARRLLWEGTQQDHSPKKDRIPGNVVLDMNEAPGSSKGMLQQQPGREEKQALRFGEGLTSTVSPSTQLFMLKRRVPHVVSAIKSIGDTGSSSSSKPVQIPRLQAIPRLLQNGALLECGKVTSAAGQRSAILATQVRSGVKSAMFPPSCAQKSSARIGGLRPHPTFDSLCEKSATLGTFTPQEERLSDHFRQRDHFGRPLGLAAGPLQVIAQAAILLVLLVCLSIQGPNLSLVLLALAVPVNCTQNTAGASYDAKAARLAGTFTRCLRRAEDQLGPPSHRSKLPSGFVEVPCA